METRGVSPADIVAVLHDEAMPPERLGELVRAARKRKGWSRKRAAARVGITAEGLRVYEKGTDAMPVSVCEALVDAYGAELIGHVPLRGELSLDTVEPADDVIAGYVKLVHRLRSTKPGRPLPLRADDVAVLAATLDSDRDEIERRVAAAIGCTRAEARALHNELLRRRVVLPVAGLAAGVAAYAGVAYAATGSAHAAPTSNGPSAPVTHVVDPPAESPAPPPTSTTTSTTTTVGPTPPPSVAPPTTVAPSIAPPPAPIVIAPPHSDAAAVVPIEPAAAPPSAPVLAAPVGATTESPGTVSVLPGEGPIAIVDEGSRPPSPG